MSIERMATDTELATVLGKSRWFVQNNCRLGLWPHCRAGKSYRFDAEQVESIRALMRVGTKVPATKPNPWGQKGKAS